MKNKKGLSAIIATAFILLVTVISITLIAQFIIPFVKNNLTDSTECVPYLEHFTFENNFDVGGESLNYNCNDDRGGGVYHSGVSVKAKSLSEDNENKLRGFALMFKKSGVTTKVEVIKGNIEDDGVKILGKGDTEPLETPESGEIRTYVYEGDGPYDSVDVLPLLKSGRTCESSESVVLEASCASGVDLA